MKHFKEPAAPQQATVMAQQAPKQRSAYWDNVKYFLILLVVLGHFFYSREDLRPVTFATLAIYTFHMPAFAFVSGYFSKSERSRSFPQLVRLAVAYVVFNGIFLLWAAYRGSDVFVTIPYYSFWYLICIIAWRFTVGRFAEFKVALPLSIVFALLIGFASDADNAFAFGRMVAFYPFFLAGYLMPRNWGERLSKISPITRVLGGLILIAATAAAIWFSYRWLHFDYDDVLMGPYERMLDLRTRAVILGIACLAILTVLVATPSAKIPLITTIGKNSLAVYLLHRYIVLVYERAYAPSANATMLFATSAVATLVVLALLGNDLVANLLNGFLDKASSLITRSGERGLLAFASKAALVLVTAATALALPYAMRKSSGGSSSSTDYAPDYARLTVEEEAALNDSYTILFAGDLVLLEDQVRLGYTGSGYDFSSVFEYTKPYIEQADLAIGVFEGVCAGEEAGYSSGNFDDAKPLWMNFPDEFAKAVADAGFDMVTTADNHFLDRGVEGAYRTLDVLEGVGITPVGTYRSAEDKEANRVRVVEAGGLKLAVLAYTYGANDGEGSFSDGDLVDGEYAALTSVIVDPKSSYFAQVRESVYDDIEYARTLGCDLVVVLPHWGTQFSHETDEFQETWREIFLKAGADIILGAHSHATQPIVFEEVGGRQTITVYSPGNYCDVYLDQDVDASALVEVRVSKESKQVIGCSIVPQWCTGTVTDNYRGLPIYSILTDAELASEISSNDMVRVEEVHKLVTSTMMGTSLGLGQARERLYMTTAGFRRASVTPLELSATASKGTLATLLASMPNVCFAGDNVTAGSGNGGYGWYEPIESLVTGELTNVSESGATSRTLLGLASRMAETKSNLYVVAIGANDVRYRDESSCAMTPEAYVENLRTLVTSVRVSVPDAQFAFIAPWTSTAGDVSSPLYVEEKREMLAAYTEALHAFCAQDGHAFIDPNPAIVEVIDRYPQSTYLVDAFHPTSAAGIQLYARSVMEAPASTATAEEAQSKAAPAAEAPEASEAEESVDAAA